MKDRKRGTKEEWQGDTVQRAVQRNKKRRRHRRFGSVFLSFFLILAITGCIYFGIQNNRLKKEAERTAQEIAEGEKEIVYDQAAVDAMLKKVSQDVSKETREDFLTRMKGFMESGEGTAAMLREFYPEEIVVASSGRYFFFPILDTIKHHNYMKEQFVLNEDQVLEYVQDGEVTSIKGIDVSKYQEEINWEKVAKDGVEYAFVRAGIRGSTEGKLIPDETFEDNMEGALDHGIDVGVYFFTQALNEAEAEEEARFVLEAIEPYDVTYPIVLDVEEITTENARTKHMTMEDWTKITIAFCEKIKEAGYTPMIYGNLKTFFLMLDLKQLEGYEKWFAYYRTPLYFPYEFGIWQYTAEGKVAGIKGPVDLNVSMKDYSKE